MKYTYSLKKPFFSIKLFSYVLSFNKIIKETDDPEEVSRWV